MHRWRAHRVHDTKTCFRIMGYPHRNLNDCGRPISSFGALAITIIHIFSLLSPPYFGIKGGNLEKISKKGGNLGRIPQNGRWQHEKNTCISLKSCSRIYAVIGLCPSKDTKPRGTGHTDNVARIRKSDKISAECGY